MNFGQNSGMHRAKGIGLESAALVISELLQKPPIMGPTRPFSVNKMGRKANSKEAELTINPHSQTPKERSLFKGRLSAQNHLCKRKTWQLFHAQRYMGFFLAIYFLGSP